MARYACGQARGKDWRNATDACLATIEVPGEGAALGFLYVTDSLAADLGEVVRRCQEVTGVEHWVGTVGMGVCATAQEYYDEPAVTVMVGAFPAGSFRVFPTVQDGFTGFDGAHADWLAAHHPQIALVHGDPRNAALPTLIEGLADRVETGFLVGGLTSSRGAYPQVADGITEGGLSGVLCGRDVLVRTRLTQGCSPIGPYREVTEADRNIVVELDGRPALDVLREDIGEILSRDLSRIGGYVFAALPVEGSDTGD